MHTATFCKDCFTITHAFLMKSFLIHLSIYNIICDSDIWLAIHSYNEAIRNYFRELDCINVINWASLKHICVWDLENQPCQCKVHEVILLQLSIQYSSFISWHSRALNTSVFFNFCWVTCVWNASDTRRFARVQYFVHCTRVIFVCCTWVTLLVCCTQVIVELIPWSTYVRGTLYARIINYEMARLKALTRRKALSKIYVQYSVERNNHACKFKFIRIRLAKPRMIHTRADFTRVSHILWRVRKSITRLVADHGYLLSGMVWHLVTQVNATSALVSARLVCVAILAPKLYLRNIHTIIVFLANFWLCLAY